MRHRRHRRGLANFELLSAAETLRRDIATPTDRFALPELDELSWTGVIATLDEALTATTEISLDCSLALTVSLGPSRNSPLAVTVVVFPTVTVCADEIVVKLPAADRVALGDTGLELSTQLDVRIATRVTAVRSSQRSGISIFRRDNHRRGI